MTLKEAQQIAQGLIQSYIGPDHRVMDMPSFFGRSCWRYRPRTNKVGMTALRPKN
jgi:hypothetical protein